MTIADRNSGGATKKIYVTLTGLPLSFHIEWPFHKSTSGADFWVLHADIRLENSDRLHAPVAVNLSATLREVLPSLEPKDTEGPVINALRKEVDRRQLEFVKSGKLVPVHFSSRHYSFQRNKWIFGKATDDQIEQLIARKVYWHSRLTGESAWLGDDTEPSYVETTKEHWLEVALNLSKQGLFKLERQWATAEAPLLEQAGRFEADMSAALAELEKKHAFERGRGNQSTISV